MSMRSFCGNSGSLPSRKLRIHPSRSTSTKRVEWMGVPEGSLASAWRKPFMTTVSTCSFGPGQEFPAVGRSPCLFAILPEHFGRIILRVDSYGDELDIRGFVSKGLIHFRHAAGHHRARTCTPGKDEVRDPDLSFKISRRHRLPILSREGELRSRSEALQAGRDPTGSNLCAKLQVRPRDQRRKAKKGDRPAETRYTRWQLALFRLRLR